MDVNRVDLTGNEVVLLISALYIMQSQPIAFGSGTRKQVKDLIKKLEDVKNGKNS
ncbi:MAG: hypothetical protein K6E20_03740 [Acholeplasmatales bacterium]|nr:hypothetical protein [Acholeplasmatales bacterium]